MHGAPQEHGYSFSNDISFFKYFNYKANSAPWLPLDAVNKLPVNGTDGSANYGLADGKRELIAPNYVALAHNHFHKPQLEFHYSNDFAKDMTIRATIFYSRGRGGGSSLNSAGGVANSARAADGSIQDTAVIKNVYLLNAYQRDSYSWHQQGGLLASLETKVSDELKMTIGGEYRSWTADHPGYFTNLYGKTNISAQQYGFIDSTGVVSAATFRRRTFQNDVDAGDMDLFGMDFANDPGYNSQYRNYRGETPQYTFFANANYQLLPNLNLSGTLQYVWYSYTLKENMPSENSIGRRLTAAQIAARGLGTTRNEGPDGSKFYMKEHVVTTNSATSTAIRNWYEFDLVNVTRTRGFLQPKFGANYNIDENLNVFGSFAHVERFVDLGVYYNQGRVNPAAGDEKSNQIEGGIGWTSRELNVKLNAYTMVWDNKSSRIQDQSQAGQPGYDRNGFRTILVGTSKNQGVELEFNGRLDQWLPIKGLDFRGSATLSENKWTEVLESVKRDPSNPNRRQVFNASGRNAAGAIDTVFMDELEGTHSGGPPQRMASFGLTYNFGDFFVGLDANYYSAHYGLDGDTYMRVDGQWNSAKTTFSYVVKQTLPTRVLYDAQAGYRFNIYGFRGFATAQVLNLFNREHLADVDNFGVIPGLLRSFRFNLNVGI